MVAGRSFTPIVAIFSSERQGRRSAPGWTSPRDAEKTSCGRSEKSAVFLPNRQRGRHDQESCCIPSLGEGGQRRGALRRARAENRAEVNDRSPLRRKKDYQTLEKSPPGEGNYPRPGGNPLDLALRADAAMGIPERASTRAPRRTQEPLPWRRRRRRCAPPTTRRTLTAHQQAFKARLPHPPKRQRSNRDRTNAHCKNSDRYQPGVEPDHPPQGTAGIIPPPQAGGLTTELKISGCGSGAFPGTEGGKAPVGAASYFPLRAHRLTRSLRPLRAGTAERGTGE